MNKWERKKIDVVVKEKSWILDNLEEKNRGESPSRPMRILRMFALYFIFEICTFQCRLLLQGRSRYSREVFRPERAIWGKAQRNINRLALIRKLNRLY